MTQIINWVVFLAFFLFSFFRRQAALCILLILLPFYAFLITYLQNFLNLPPESLFLIRLIKEGILLAIFISLIYSWLKPRAVKKQTINFYFSDIFILIYLIILITSGLIFHSSFKEIFFGLRYDFFFFFSYFIFRIYFIFSQENKERKIIKLILITAIIIFIFALSQFFVLPKDFLTQFGYSQTANSEFDTQAPIAAFHLLGNADILRVQSFFAGPNQLASFTLVIIFLSWAMALSKKFSVLAWFNLILGIIILFLTFSRSAWVGFGLGIIILAIFNFKKKPLFSGIIFGLILAFIIFSFVFFKEQINEIIIRPSSSVWHVAALKESWETFKTHLFGMGLGKIGPASQWLQKPIISENYYLQIGLETGVLGLVFFILAWIFLIADLKQKKSVFADSAIALIISLLVACLFLHTLADGVLSFYIGLFLAMAQTKKTV